MFNACCCCCCLNWSCCGKRLYLNICYCISEALRSNSLFLLSTHSCYLFLIWLFSGQQQPCLCFSFFHLVNFCLLSSTLGSSKLAFLFLVSDNFYPERWSVRMINMLGKFHRVHILTSLQKSVVLSLSFFNLLLMIKGKVIDTEQEEDDKIYIRSSTRWHMSNTLNQIPVD